MPDKCVVYGCSNQSDSSRGISLHRIPFWNDIRSEAKRRRAIWTKFVSTKRDKWKATKFSAICSDHFKEDDHERYAVEIPGTKDYTPRLRRDEIGIIVYPTIYRKPKEPVDVSRREKRQAEKERAELVSSLVEETHTQSQSSSGQGPSTSADYHDPSDPEPQDDADELSKDTSNEPLLCDPFEQFVDAESQTEPCKNCAKLRNGWLGTKHKLKLCREKLKQLEKDKAQVDDQCGEDEDMEDMDEEMPLPAMDEDSEREEYEEEIDDAEYVLIDQESTSSSSNGDSETEMEQRVHFSDKDGIRLQPKFIVFLSQLLMLFNFCPFCKESNPKVETRQMGSMATITSTCTNLHCGKKFVWRSQPFMPGTKIPAGNFLLSFGTLLAGSSASKVVQICKHIGLACISLRTYFKHQRTILFPSIFLHWKTYRNTLIDQAKAVGSKLVLAGDGRHDSMGHSAKYCTSTIFCCTTSSIIHFDLVQRNEAGSSPAMEYLGFQRCMTYLMVLGLSISTFISDRHLQIAKHMKTHLSTITHYFDLWHLKKKITKILTTISKESGCEALVSWIKAAGNHLYWSACSTHDGNGKVIWAKFWSFLSHIINKHDDLEDPLFNKCAHGDDIPHRGYLTEGSIAHEKLKTKLTKPRLVKAIQKASPISQTSCLEGFHSVVNQFSPKMICYSFPGMYCRHILAAIHFNYNLQRKVKTREDGTDQYKVVYPKFKNGEGTVRSVRVKQNFDYVEEIFLTVMKALEEKTLDEVLKELKKMTPAPMSSMLEKQTKEEAVKKQELCRQMVTKNVPPTTPVPELSQEPRGDNPHAERAKPHCKECGNPMKGHKKVADCPRNIRNQQQLFYSSFE